jgi:poly-gamma-glutamate synthesis protein (capsule biosynthesis protein)
MNTLSLLACGDVGPIHQPIERYSELVKPVLQEADLRFAQVERVYSTRGEFQLHSNGAHSRVPPHMISVFTDCGFDVVSLASNHAMDWGSDALLDTADLLRSKGIKVVGAGRNLAEARAPEIIEKNGVKVAFLAYCSILQNGYAAGPASPGVAPLRVHTYYEAFDYQPGIPPRVITIPNAEDLANLVEDIKNAKARADAVVVSLHWGVHYIPRLIADYQVAVAEAAIGAGADLLLGHHAHTPKAIGVHHGAVCFYSLSNFIMSSTAKSPEKAASFERKYGVVLDPDYPHLSYGSDAKRSLVAKAIIGQKGIEKVSFLPVLIDKKLRPEVLCNGDARFQEAVQFMEWVSEDFDHQFKVDGDEVLITSRK